MVLTMIIKALGAFLELLIPRAMGSLIDIGLQNKDLGYIKTMLIVMIFLTLSSGLASMLANVFGARYSHKASAYIREQCFEKIQFMKLEAVDTFTIQSLMTRVTGDADIIQRMLEMMVRPMVRGPLLIIGGLILSFMTSLKLTLIILAGMLFVSLVSYSIYVVANPLFRKIQRLVDTLTRIIREGLTGIRLIKTLNKEGYEVSRISETGRQIQKNEIKAGVFHGVLNPMVTLIANITLILTILASRSLIVSGEITIGEITAIIQYINMILLAMRLIPRLFLMLGRANVSSERLFAILENNETYQYGTIATKDGAKVLLDVKDLCFAYPGNRDILSGISFTLEKGEKIGILGDTGSGKSTLTALLLGLYPNHGGRILLYGESLFSYERETLRKIITAAPQKANIYNISIRENIRLHSANDDEKLAKVIKVAQLQEFVSEKELGIDFILEQNGKNLSGGQRQRINIARTLYTEADIMIFDDISSGLDYKTERNLHEELHAAYQENSFIFMSQNIRSVKDCDKIFLLQKGRFVAEGSHDQLLQDSPLYQTMWQLQNIEEHYS